MSSRLHDRAGLLSAFNHQTQLLTAAIVMFEQAAADQLALNITDLHCANVLRLHGPMTAGQLAELTSLTTGAITAMIDRLVRAGYVRRASDPHDRRRVMVQADSAAMERDIGPLYTPLAHATAAMIARYSDDELALLVDQLTRSSAVTLDEAVKLRHAAVRASAAAVDATSGSDPVVVPLGTVAEGQLIAALGATRLTIAGDLGQADLLRAQFGAPTATVAAEAGLVKLFYHHARLNRSANTADVTLNGNIPWQLTLMTSGAPCSADLRQVPLRGLDLTTKASNIELTLPRPQTGVTLRIAGSASNVVVRCAADTAVQVRLGRSGSSLVWDGQDLSAAAQQFYRTPGYEQAAQYYDIEITARLTTVTLETQ